MTNLLLLLLSRFSRVRLCATPETAAHKAPPSLGFSNLDSILKSRDVTLPTKVHLVKGMVFSVVMYGCESWTVKKAEHRRIDVLNCGV